MGVKILSIFWLLASFSYANSKVSVGDFLKTMDQNKVTFSIKSQARDIAVKQFQLFCMIQLESEGRTDKSECTSPVDDGLINLNIKQNVIPLHEREVVGFREEMLNVRYIDYKGFRYSVYYDFELTHSCTLQVEKLSSVCGEPVCGNIFDKNFKESYDSEKTSIDMKYCKKYYGEIYDGLPKKENK